MLTSAAVREVCRLTQVTGCEGLEVRRHKVARRCPQKIVRRTHVQRKATSKVLFAVAVLAFLPMRKVP